MSEQYLDYARAHRSHQNARYEQGDARKLPYPDNSFDAAISTLAIDVVPYAEEIVVEMCRVVKPGGILASALHEYRSAFAPTFMLLDIAAGTWIRKRKRSETICCRTHSSGQMGRRLSGERSV